MSNPQNNNFTKKEIALAILAFVLALTFGFGAGYLARGEGKVAPIIIEKNSQ